MGFIINTAVQRSELRTILFNDRCRCALSQQRPQGASTEPPGEPGAAKCAKLLCPGCRARVPPSSADDYAAAPPFIRAASHCVGFVKGYHSMWLQPAEHRTQPATAPVKACGKKVCRPVIFLLLTRHDYVMPGSSRLTILGPAAPRPP